MANPTLRIRYQTLEIDGIDIHLKTLRDTQQFQDDDDEALDLGISSAMWPIFGVVWDSGIVLAHLMASYEIQGRRVLELGCGMALASHVLRHREVDITATDFHPEVAGFLKSNEGLNGGRTIPFVRTGWEDSPTDLGRFDLIIGSDVLYERALLAPLSRFIEQHAETSCDVILVDPGRSNRGRFAKLMVAQGYETTRSRPEAAYLDAPFKGEVLAWRRRGLGG